MVHSLDWKVILEDAFRNYLGGALVCVIRTTTQAFSYRIETGGTVVPLGESDLHDAAFDAYRYDRLLTAPAAVTDPLLFSQTSVPYTISIFPTSEFFPTMQPTNNPTISPTVQPSASPTKVPTFPPIKKPTLSPSTRSTTLPTVSTIQTAGEPTMLPSESRPSSTPTLAPVSNSTAAPTANSTTATPVTNATANPTTTPTSSCEHLFYRLALAISSTALFWSL